MNNFKDFCTEHGSSQGQNLALTGLFVPSWVGSGPCTLARVWQQAPPPVARAAVREMVCQQAWGAVRQIITPWSINQTRFIKF